MSDTECNGPRDNRSISGRVVLRFALRSKQQDDNPRLGGAYA